jgi:hypothetical protein
MESQNNPMHQPNSSMDEMPKGEMEPNDQLETAIDRGVTRVVDHVVDQALAQFSDENERELLRSSLTTVVRETLREVATKEVRNQMSLAQMAQPSGAMVIGDATQAGMNAAKQVQNLGFVEFTAGLINGTFDAIVGATVKQMEAYAKLVADLAKSLAQFQAENVSDAQINAHLGERYPDGEGGTVVRKGYKFEDTVGDTTKGITAKTATEKALEVAFALIAETSNLRSPSKPLTRADLNIPTDPIPTAFSFTEFTDPQLIAIRKAISQSLATTMMDHLRAMAREGMARIVITEGEIFTKLTFNVSTTEVDTRRKDDYHRDSAGAYIRGSAWAGWGTVSAGGNWNQLNINTVNETSFDKATMSTEIIGQVKLNFKTESFPPITTQATT